MNTTTTVDYYRSVKPSEVAPSSYGQLPAQIAAFSDRECNITDSEPATGGDFNMTLKTEAIENGTLHCGMSLREHLLFEDGMTVEGVELRSDWAEHVNLSEVTLDNSIVIVFSKAMKIKWLEETVKKGKNNYVIPDDERNTGDNPTASLKIMLCYKIPVGTVIRHPFTVTADNYPLKGHATIHLLPDRVEPVVKVIINEEDKFVSHLLQSDLAVAEPHCVLLTPMPGKAKKKKKGNKSELTSAAMLLPAGGSSMP